MKKILGVAIVAILLAVGVYAQEVSKSFSTATNLRAYGTAVTLANSTILSWSGREFLASTAAGLFKISGNSGSTPMVEMNTGTASPTATTCVSGTMTAKSTNSGGEVTATGATTCTVTFGTPAWSNAPFCAVTDETTAAALRISARSTTAITVTGLTSGDVFMYTCIGGL